jgi:hypothetical protein
MEWLFHRSLVPGGTAGMIVVTRVVDGELREVYRIDRSLVEGGPITLVQAVRDHFRIPHGATVNFVDVV